MNVVQIVIVVGFVLFSLSIVATLALLGGCFVAKRSDELMEIQKEM